MIAAVGRYLLDIILCRVDFLTVAVRRRKLMLTGRCATAVPRW